MLEKPTKMMNPDTTMEDLLNRTNNLTVLDEDGWEINEARGSEVNALCAMGRWCSNRPMSRSLLRTILGRVWGISDKEWTVKIKFTMTAASFLVFSFKSTKDLNRILAKNPWFLNNGILIMERFNGTPPNWEICLTKFPISGRILNLPACSITKGNLERLARFAGEVLEIQKIDIPKIVSKGFFTFKVLYDISKLICPGFLFPFEGQKIWLPYRYDRLPYMCFNCGFVGHDTRVCAEPMKFFEDGLGNQIPGYGSWLKIVEQKEPPLSHIKISTGNFSPMSPAPGFKEIPSSSSGMIHSSGNKGVNHKTEARTGVHSEAFPISGISLNMVGSRLSEKGKEKVIDDSHGLLMEVPLSMTVGNFADNSEHLKGANQGSSKRNGAWREESMADLVNSLTSAKFSHSRSQENSIKSPIIDSSNLMDMPINYDSNIEALIKMEGPTKRRKVPIPKDVTLNSLLTESGNWKIHEVGSWFHKDDIPWLIRKTLAMLYGDVLKFFKFGKRSAGGVKPAAASFSPFKADYNTGRMVVAEVTYIPGCLSVQLAEAAAIKLGIQLASTWFIQKARLGSDCQTIVKAINSNLRMHSDWGQVVMDINHLKSLFQDLSFVYFPRMCNQVANSLAKLSLKTQKSIVMTNVLPSCAAALLKAQVPSVV
ncbi:hypothetical protein F8388_024935 [Cannabis sativa]|uniref:CCHC-type domain-containing protein n=1 Tax=Cannabis sativa TaxID=3483 RepID=A0A7J6GAP6_CANSA|nr:hypothetical protein G4B88_030343 [Cannabis sativa]KAF4379902.1 hypothetical protein F8388_024935 [Cannabis sativa]